MEVKKSPKADLNNKKLLFVEIGLVLSLLVTIGAFEYKTREKTASVFDDQPTELIEEEIIPITQDTPPPPPEAPKMTTSRSMTTSSTSRTIRTSESRSWTM